MSNKKLIDKLELVTKLIIFPFFYFVTFLIILITSSIASGDIKNYYGEAIEGIAIGIMIVAPILLIIIIPVSFLILKLARMTHLLKNDWLLAIWGIVSAFIGISLISVLGWLIKFF
ncbi:hypothetical protein KJ918_07170 [Patescibacteria group bacterium]|nr:hypothetical protein [Patescibacteria group bacterium]